MTHSRYDRNKASTLGSLQNLSEADLKSAWLASMRTWGDLGLASDHIHSSPLRAIGWEADDGEFRSQCEEIRKLSETMSRDLIRQRANQGEAAARTLALKSAQPVKSKAEAEPAEGEPAPRRTREEHFAYIDEKLKAAGIEIPDNLSEEVYSAEQWAKWGR